VVDDVLVSVDAIEAVQVFMCRHDAKDLDLRRINDLRDLGQLQIDRAYQRSEWILYERLVMMTPS
jgi:hypothetical protein